MELVTKKIDNVPGMNKKQNGSNSLITLTFYNEPPTQEISLDEFEIFALDRLQLLRNIEKLKIGGYNEKELKEKIDMCENKYMPLRDTGEGSLMEGMRKDVASHFILRLAYSRTQDLRQWLVEQECSLFRHRFDRMKKSDKLIEFMIRNGLEYDMVSTEKKNELKDKLVGLGGVTEISFITSTFYRIPFQQAIRLLLTRSVYLESGYAFVPFEHLEAIVLMRFRSYLARALAEAALTFEVVNGDARIGPLLKNLSKQYIGKDFNKTSSVDKLTPDKVDEAAEMHMPLCMKTLHSQLKKDHKLKHQGRLQYGLFLKGAGLDLDDALTFFENHFGRVMTHDQFVKDYSYSFRHMYGKEGNRKNYTPYSCMKIILGPPPQPGIVHGCPYRHASDGQLAAMLSSLKISSGEVKDIVQLAKGGGHYQLACQKHFDITHPDRQTILSDSQQLDDTVANHPNAWFHASMQYHHAKNNLSSSSQSGSQSGVFGGKSQSSKMPLDSPTTVSSFSYSAQETSMMRSVFHDKDKDVKEEEEDDLIMDAQKQLEEEEYSSVALKRNHSQIQKEEVDTDGNVDDAAMEVMFKME